MAVTMETIDLVHSYLTENRVLGVCRTQYNEKARLIMRHSRYPEITLAIVTTDGTRATISSVYLKPSSASSSELTTIDLVNPQGLQQLEAVLHQIAKHFNDFVKLYNMYRMSLKRFINYPTDSLSEHIFQA